MYVLIFVTMMLMLLSILTYARLDSYRNLSGLQAEFKRYMEVLEREHINQEANRWYESTVVNKRNGASGSPTTNPQTVQPPSSPTGIPQKTPSVVPQQLPSQNPQNPSTPQLPETPASKGKPSSRLSFY